MWLGLERKQLKRRGRGVDKLGAVHSRHWRIRRLSAAWARYADPIGGFALVRRRSRPRARTRSGTFQLAPGTPRLVTIGVPNPGAQLIESGGDSSRDRAPQQEMPSLRQAPLKLASTGTAGFQPARRRLGSLSRQWRLIESGDEPRNRSVHQRIRHDRGAAGRAPGALSPRRAKPTGKPALPVAAGPPSRS